MTVYPTHSSKALTPSHSSRAHRSKTYIRCQLKTKIQHQCSRRRPPSIVAEQRHHQNPLSPTQEYMDVKHSSPQPLLSQVNTRLSDMATIPLERGGTYHPGTWKPTIDTDSVGGLLYAPNQQPYSYCYPSRPMGEAGTASRPQSRSPPGGYITAPSSPTSSSPSSPSSSRSSTSSPSPTEETNENPSLPASSSTLPPMPVSVKSRPTTDLETTGDRPHPVASTSFAVNNMAPHNRVGRAPPLLSSNPLRPSTHLEEDRNNPEPATSSSPPNSATMLLSSRGAGSMPLLATNRGHHREEVITRLATTTLDIESRHHQIGCHLVRILDLVEELVGLDRQKQELTSQFWMNGMDLHSQVHLSHVLRSRRVASRRPYPRSPVSPSLSTYSDEDIKKMGRDFSTDTSTLSSALKQRWLL